MSWLLFLIQEGQCIQPSSEGTVCFLLWSIRGTECSDCVLTSQRAHRKTVTQLHRALQIRTVGSSMLLVLLSATACFSWLLLILSFLQRTKFFQYIYEGYKSEIINLCKTEKQTANERKFELPSFSLSYTIRRRLEGFIIYFSNM